MVVSNPGQPALIAQTVKYNDKAEQARWCCKGEAQHSKRKLGSGVVM
jgi:hypothetical protein